MNKHTSTSGVRDVINISNINQTAVHMMHYPQASPSFYIIFNTFVLLSINDKKLSLTDSLFWVATFLTMQKNDVDKYDTYFYKLKASTEPLSFAATSESSRVRFWPCSIFKEISVVDLLNPEILEVISDIPLADS